MLVCLFDRSRKCSSTVWRTCVHSVNPRNSSPVQPSSPVCYLFRQENRSDLNKQTHKQTYLLLFYCSSPCQCCEEEKQAYVTGISPVWMEKCCPALIDFITHKWSKVTTVNCLHMLCLLIRQNPGLCILYWDKCVLLFLHINKLFICT